jgi:hypothetical protein
MTRAGRQWVILACLVGALLCPAGAWAARPLALGIFDGAFTGPNAQTWLQRSVAAGAEWVRIDIGWDAPNTATRPAGFDARNPADPHYDFTRADAAIRLASELGLRILVTFTGAPQWAEGLSPPASAPPGTWRPNPQAVGDYGAAIANRYSGHFPDPENPGHGLPRVAAFQVWNEPNLPGYLNPQWSGGHTASPAIYRAMLNSFYAAVKSVDPRALVVTAGTAPFGDPQAGGPRIQPARFWRDLLCLSAPRGGGLRAIRCGDPAHFDVLAHHPYAWGSPERHALWPDDVAIPDMGKLTRLLRAAERTGGALPHIHHPVWVTEVGYNTKPPNPKGLPIVEDSRWVEQTLEVLWRAGVSTIMWNQVGDQRPDPSYFTTSQSGLYFLNGRPKPALTAFRFPLVGWRSGAGTARLWGRAPAGGRLAIEQRTASGWKTVRRLSVQARATFLVTVAAGAQTVLMARLGRQTSLAWSMG